MPATNGASASVQTFERYAEESARSMAAEADSLRGLIEREERVRAELQVHADACADRMRRLKRALSALTDEPTPPKKKDGNDWSVSAKKVEEVYAAFLAVDVPISPGALADRTEGLSAESVRRAVEVLRRDGRLRLVGKTAGGGRSFAVIKEVEKVG